MSADLSPEHVEALDLTDEQHDYPVETDDGLVMRCACGATPPSHLLGGQVDESFWLWQHRRAMRHATVAAMLAEAVDQEKRRAAELGDRYHDVLDHEIAQSIRTDQEYLAAHDAAVLRDAALREPTSSTDHPCGICGGDLGKTGTSTCYEAHRPTPRTEET